MKLVSRLLRNPAKQKPSPSMWGETGFDNWFGGFHHLPDREVYFRLWLLIIKKPWSKAYWKLGCHYMWCRWIHRSCDTTDFHHDIYCPLDPWVQKREREHQWTKVWEGYYETRV